MEPDITITALRTVYGPKWKCGESPAIAKLGSVVVPGDLGIEECATIARRAYPSATDAKIHQDGRLIAWTNNM